MTPVCYGVSSYRGQVPQPLPPAGPDDPQPDPDAAADLEALAATAHCLLCGHAPLEAHWRPRWLVAEPATYALAGQQLKAPARLVAWPWLACPACKMASRGK